MAAQPAFSVELPTSNAFAALASSTSGAAAEQAGAGSGDDGLLDERLALALRLVDAVLERDDALVRKLVIDEGADCWVQDRQGWSALHAAAYTGNVEHIELLLRRGNAVWALTDNLGCTAGDIAFSMNHAKAYQVLLGEGVRAEMLRAVLEAAKSDESDDEADEEAADAAEGAPVASTSGVADGDAEMGEGEGEGAPPPGAVTIDMQEGESVEAAVARAMAGGELSTASDNATFLASRLTFTQDAAGQPVALDAEGNGVMMGWESGIMRRTADRLCEAGWRDRREGGKSWEELKREEEDEDSEREPLRVMNVGFGLGIIDSFLQEYRPTSHLIIEPHPDVLAFARENGWYDKPGVRFYEGTWKQFFADLQSGKEEYLGWDAVYFDTYSEHYADLHEFFSSLPDLLSMSPHARFSFFHGLGATSRLLYDVYTSVSELHLRELGLETEWDEVDVAAGSGAETAVGRWSSTGKGAAAAAALDGVVDLGNVEEQKYWREEMVGRYRLPVCRLGL